MSRISNGSPTSRTRASMSPKQPSGSSLGFFEVERLMALAINSSAKPFNVRHAWRYFGPSASQYSEPSFDRLERYDLMISYAWLYVMPHDCRADVKLCCSMPAACEFALVPRRYEVEVSKANLWKRSSRSTVLLQLSSPGQPIAANSIWMCCSSLLAVFNLRSPRCLWTSLRFLCQASPSVSSRPPCARGFRVVARLLAGRQSVQEAFSMEFRLAGSMVWMAFGARIGRAEHECFHMFHTFPRTVRRASRHCT